MKKFLKTRFLIAVLVLGYSGSAAQLSAQGLPWPKKIGGVGNVVSPEPRDPSGYKVGANYHGISEKFVTKPGVFLRYYHKTETRMIVQRQLKEMADSGASVVKTFIWMVDDPANITPDTPEREGAWRLTFPLSAQNLTNIVQYTMDVGNTVARDGHHLELRFTLGWLGCADLLRHNSDGTYTWCHKTWAEFIRQAKESVSNLVYNVGPIKRMDGISVVSTIYLTGEVSIRKAAPEDDDYENFLLEMYPYLTEQTKAFGVTPSVYFIIGGEEWGLFDDAFVDPEYPAINGHRSLWSLYPTTEFFRAQGWPVPERLDFSFYPIPDKKSYRELVHRVLDDVAAVYGSSKKAGISETYYPIDLKQRFEMGQAFANEFLARGNPVELIFWPMPYGDGQNPGPIVGPPFDFHSFLPQEESRGIIRLPRVLPFWQMSR